MVTIVLVLEVVDNVEYDVEIAVVVVVESPQRPATFVDKSQCSVSALNTKSMGHSCYDIKMK